MIPYFQWTEFFIGPVRIYVWGLWVALGLLVAVLAALRVAEKQGVNKDRVFDLSIWIIFWGVVGSRALYVVSEWQYFAQHPLEIIALWNGGMSITGGMLGGVLYLWWVLREDKKLFLQYLEIVALVCPLGMMIGRVGCFCIYDHPGTSTDMPWGQRYSDGIVRHNHGLYLSIHAGIIAVIFWILYRRNPKRPPGSYIALFLVLYGIPRFLLDFWRATDLLGSDPRFYGLTIAQYVSLFMIAAGSALWYTIHHGKASKTS